MKRSVLEAASVNIQHFNLAAQKKQVNLFFCVLQLKIQLYALTVRGSNLELELCQQNDFTKEMSGSQR